MTDGPLSDDRTMLAPHKSSLDGESTGEGKAASVISGATLVGSLVELENVAVKKVGIISDGAIDPEETQLITETVPIEPQWWMSKYLPGYSPSRMLEFKNHKTYYLAINLLAGLAILFYGYDQGVMSLVNLDEDYQKHMGIYPATTPRNVAALGGIVAVYYIGSLIGALVGGALADRSGRITAIILGVFIAIIGGIFQSSAYDITWMCCARVVSGLGVGTIDAVIPVWSAELSSHQGRGSFLAVEFFLNIAGLCLAYWLEIGTGFSQNKVFAWRLPVAFQLVFLIVIIAIVPFFPESPRWLAKVGRVSEARRVLRITRSGDVDAELRMIVKSVNIDRVNEADNTYWRMMFPKTKAQREVRWRVVLSVWLQIMQELVGIGVITVYATVLIQGAGYSELTSKLIAGGNNISYMFSVLFAVFFIDKCGRRSTLVWGALIMAAFLLAGGILDKFAQTPGAYQQQYGAAVVACVYAYTATFGATWLVIPWLYPTELFPTYVRAKGGAWSVVGWSIGNGIVTMITPFLAEAIGYGVFLLFFGLNLAVIPFIIFLYPDTCGRPLEQINDFFSNATSWNVMTASKQIKEKGLPAWRWTRKYVGGVELHDSATEISEDKHRHGTNAIGRLRRKVSNAGLI